MRRFRLSKYVVDFVISARCAVIKSLAITGQAIVKTLSRIEARWVKWTSIGRESRMDRDNRTQFLDGLHWRERRAYLDAEDAENAAQQAARAGIDEDKVRALILDSETDVEVLRWTPLSAWQAAA
jgi:hypothetical protein